MELENTFLDESQILSKIGSWSWNVTTNEVIWSKNMFRILGLKPGAHEPSYDLALRHVHPSDKTQYEETLANAIQNKIEYYFENRIRKKNKKVVPVISRGRCILDKDENLIQMIGTVQDVSIQKNLEKLETEKTRAEERDKIKSLVLGLIAHDIKGPLNHIKGFSEILIEAILNKDYEDILEHGHIINKSSIQIRKVLDVLFQWTLTDTNKGTFNPELISPTSLIESTIEYLNISINKKNISIVNNTDPEINIFADKNIFSSLVRNILSNAIKYSHNGGEVSIDCTQGINEVTISISDKGIGMAPKQMLDIFSSKTIRSVRGTDNEIGYGMGLKLCKTLIESHNGKIWFESTVGEGTTCHFTLA